MQPTSTEITPEVIAQVVTLANECTLHDNPRSGFYRLLPGILAASLCANVSGYGRRYDHRQMMAILELAEPQIALSQPIVDLIKREWLILVSAYGDVIRGDIHPAMARLTNTYLSGGDAVAEVRRFFAELEDGAEIPPS